MSRLGSLQVLRAMAALAIALLHFQTEAHTMAAASGQAFSGVLLAHLGAGVDLFFVISGFVMVYASKSLFQREGAATEFLGRRLARIVPLYWVMTTLFVAVLLSSPALLSTGGVTPLEILKSYFFIPYVAAGTGLMQPVYKLGWTLNYEMTFYLAFSLFLFLPMQKAILLLVGLFSTMVVMGQLVAPAPGAVAFWTDPIILEFAFGALIGLAYLTGKRITTATAVISVLSGVVLLAASPYLGFRPDGPLRPFLWGVPAALILAGTLLLERSEAGTQPRTRLTALLEKMGDASYAIYLVHPLVIRGGRLVWDKSGMGAVLPLWLYVIGGLCLLIGLSILVYQWFELPLTRAAQQRLRQKSTPGLATAS